MNFLLSIKIFIFCFFVYVEGMEFVVFVVGGIFILLIGFGGLRGMFIIWYVLFVFFVKDNFLRERSLFWWKRKFFVECIMIVCWII